MSEEKTSLGLRGNLSILLPALWLLIGASFKLFAGGPNDLPPLILNFGREHDILSLVFYGAIGIELSIVALALFRPALGWGLLCMQYCIFIALLVQLQLSGADSCGCMGSSVAITPLTMLAIDGALFALLILEGALRLRLPARGPAWFAPALVLGCLVFPWFFSGAGTQPQKTDPAGAGGKTAEIEKPQFVDLQLGKWVDQDIFSTPLAPWIPLESGELPIDGLYVFYRQTCEHCADHLMKLFEEDVGFPMVLVKINEKGDDEENDLILVKPEGPHIIEIELDSEIQWVIETPADLELAGGMVIRGEEGIGKD